jgi:hypothetical protein
VPERSKEEMDSHLQLRMHSGGVADPEPVLPNGTFSLWDDNSSRCRLSLDPDKVKNGLGRLVLTLVKLLHELLERQALRRIEAGSLSEEQIEKIGLTLSRQAETLERLRKEFGLEEEDLNLDLGPLGRLV